MFRTDTDVISTIAPTKAAPDQRIVQWIRAHSSVIFLSVISLAEIQRGIALSVAKGHSRKSGSLVNWYETLLRDFSGRVLAVDERIAHRAGELLGRAEAGGASPGLSDACIAATAEIHGFTLVSMNHRHFQAFGVSLGVPWEGPPP